MAKTDSKEVAVQTQSTAVAVADDYAAYAGAGFENQTSEDYAIPFINILQALSPQLQPPQADESLRQGMLFNNVTQDAVAGNKGIAFVPATTQHMFVEFKPRETGGGFVAAYQPTDAVVEQVKAAATEFGSLKMPNGNDLIETFYVYGLVIYDDGSHSQAVVGFNSSKIKKYRGWMTKAKMIQLAMSDGRRISAPLFAHRYRLTTEMEKNTKGAFFNWNINFDGADAPSCRLLPSDPIFQEAVAIKGLIESGKARAAHEQTHSETVTGSADAAATGGKPVF